MYLQIRIRFFVLLSLFIGFFNPSFAMDQKKQKKEKEKIEELEEESTNTIIREKPSENDTFTITFTSSEKNTEEEQASSSEQSKVYAVSRAVINQIPIFETMISSSSAPEEDKNKFPLKYSVSQKSFEKYLDLLDKIVSPSRNKQQVIEKWLKKNTDPTLVAELINLSNYLDTPAILNVLIKAAIDNPLMLAKVSSDVFQEVKNHIPYGSYLQFMCARNQQPNLISFTLPKTETSGLDLLTWTSDSNYIVTASKYGIYAYNVKDKNYTQQYNIRAENARNNPLSFVSLSANPNNMSIAIGCHPCSILLWNLENSNEKIEIPFYNPYSSLASINNTFAAWSDNNNIIYTSVNSEIDGANSIQILNTTKRGIKSKWLFMHRKGPIISICCNPNKLTTHPSNDIVSAAFIEKTPLTYVPDFKDPLTRVNRPQNEIKCYIGVFNKEQKNLAFTYNLRIKDTPITFHETNSDAYSIAWNPKKPLLAWCGKNNYIGIMKLTENNEPTAPQTLHIDSSTNYNMHSISWHPNGNLLAAGSTDKTIHLWDVSTKSLVGKLPVGQPVSSVAFSPNGLQLACTCRDNKVRVFSIFNTEIQTAVNNIENSQKPFEKIAPIVFAQAAITQGKRPDWYKKENAQLLKDARTLLPHKIQNYMYVPISPSLSWQYLKDLWARRKSTIIIGTGMAAAGCIGAACAIKKYRAK